MDNHFNDDEKLYRAVFPPEMAELYRKRDGTISSAAFVDPKGLSVERGYYRENTEVLSIMQKRFVGRIICLYVKNCRDAGAVVLYRPTGKNPYHSEIHGRLDTPLLSKPQRRHLARTCRGLI